MKRTIKINILDIEIERNGDKLSMRVEGAVISAGAPGCKSHSKLEMTPQQAFSFSEILAIMAK